MFGINKSCSRMWDARSAIWTETKNLIGKRAPLSLQEREKVEKLEKREIVAAAVVAFILALGVSALLFHGMLSLPHEPEYLAQGLLLGFSSSFALATAVAIPLVAESLLKQKEKASQALTSVVSN